MAVVKKVYYKNFLEYRDIITQNINLDEGGILGTLSSNGVIDDKCVTAIGRPSDAPSKGNVLVNYLLGENKVEKYEDFLDVWNTTNHDEADELRTKIHNALTSQGLKVPAHVSKLSPTDKQGHDMASTSSGEWSITLPSLRL